MLLPRRRAEAVRSVRTVPPLLWRRVLGAGVQGALVSAARPGNCSVSVVLGHAARGRNCAATLVQRGMQEARPEAAPQVGPRSASSWPRCAAGRLLEFDCDSGPEIR